MPWCEYISKSFAYDRQQRDEWKKVKYLAYHSLLASPYIDPKKLPSLQQFVSNESKPIKRVSNEQRDLFLQEVKEYYKLIKQK